MFSKTIFIIAIGCVCATSNPLQASFKNSLGSPSMGEVSPTISMAATRSKDRRDNRQDDRGRQDNREDRRDCRDEEGVAGKDKRDCKQDARTGKDKKEKDGGGGHEKA
jgi:hypothetical protein